MSVNFSSDKTLSAVGVFFRSLFEGKADIVHTHSRSDISDFPSSLPANGGNADTLEGLGADDFVKSGKGQITIPAGVDVPIWIRNNAKRYTVYQTAGSSSYSNLPNNSTDYVWYIYNGNFIFAYINSEHRLYVCDTINGVFSGWQALFTTRHKPFVTGMASISYGNSGTTHNLQVLNFTPSAVICRQIRNDDLNGKIMWATPSDKGFQIITDADLTTNVIQYIAFR